MTCLMMRPSAKRTILLTTPLLNEKKSKRKKSPNPQNANPIYMWMVQPKEETGLKEGRFTLARSSQKTFTLDPNNRRRSSSLYTESSSAPSSNLSRTSSMSTSNSFLSRTSSICTRTSIMSEGEHDLAQTHGVERPRSSSVVQGIPVGGRGSFLYNFL